MNKFNTVVVVVAITLICSCKTAVESTPLRELIGRHKVVFTEPPTKIPVPHSIDAPMLGNGFTGVAISGPPEKQVYYLARNDFWRLKSSFNESFPSVLGKIEIDIPGLKDASYRIEQDLYSAVTYSNFSKDRQEVHFNTLLPNVELGIVNVKRFI